MAQVAILNYIKRQSPVHELTGTTKLIFFIAWSITSMVTFDTRVLLCMLLIGAVLCWDWRWCFFFSITFLFICSRRSTGWNCMKAGRCCLPLWDVIRLRRSSFSII